MVVSAAAVAVVLRVGMATRELRGLRAPQVLPVIPAMLAQHQRRFLKLSPEVQAVLAALVGAAVMAVAEAVEVPGGLRILVVTAVTVRGEAADRPVVLLGAEEIALIPGVEAAVQETLIAVSRAIISVPEEILGVGLEGPEEAAPETARAFTEPVEAAEAVRVILAAEAAEVAGEEVSLMLEGLVIPALPLIQQQLTV